MFHVERKKDVEILSMQSGPANAMDIDFCLELTGRFREMIDSPSRALLFTGKEKIFCAGVDLPKMLEGGQDYARKFLPVLGTLLETVFFCPKPVVAAINGHAIAGGCLLTSCADRRIMVDGKARIGVPELRIGVPFPTLLMEILRARTNPLFFEEVVLGGATYTAHEALQRGLVDVVVEEGQLLPLAQTSAESLAAIRPEIYAFSKQQVRQPVREALESRRYLQSSEFNSLWESEVTRASIRAFVEQTLKK